MEEEEEEGESDREQIKKLFYEDGIVPFFPYFQTLLICVCNPMHEANQYQRPCNTPGKCLRKSKSKKQHSFFFKTWVGEIEINLEFDDRNGFFKW